MSDVEILRITWKGESYGPKSGNTPVESGVFPPATLPPARLASYVSNLTGGSVYRVTVTGKTLLPHATALLRAKSVQFFQVWKGDDVLLIYEVGSGWDAVPRSIAQWSDPSAAITIVAKKDAHLAEGIGFLCRLPLFSLDALACLEHLSQSAVETSLFLKHCEKLHYDLVEGVCARHILLSAPLELTGEFVLRP